MSTVSIRPVLEEDLPALFEHQADPEANLMAAFTARDPSDEAAFRAHCRRILAEPSVAMRTVISDGRVVGSVGRYRRDNRCEVTYWIGRPYWGLGFATAALKLLLEETEERPLYAAAASDNLGSTRVLEKCGFVSHGTARGFASARGAEIEEVCFVLH